MDLGIRGRKAIVCAASRGLGRACAAALAREGVDVVINARDAATLDATAEEIRRATGVRMTAVAGDVTTDEGRGRLLAACPEPDILVNNAGGPPPGDFRDWDRDAWLRAIDANMLTAIFLIRATVDGMVRRKFGRIVSITSVVGFTGNPGQANYAAAKAGLLGFTRSLAKEVASRGITVNAVAPGFIDTDMTRALTEEQRAALAGQIPMERLGRAEDVAAAVLFLASRQADYITGETLHVNGGLYMA